MLLGSLSAGMSKQSCSGKVSWNQQGVRINMAKDVHPETVWCGNGRDVSMFAFMKEITHKCILQSVWDGLVLRYLF